MKGLGVWGGRKTDRFHFATFTCDKCGTPQTHCVKRTAKTASCHACGRIHKILLSETSLTPTSKKAK